jgi:hypothetical protein
MAPASDPMTFAGAAFLLLLAAASAYYFPARRADSLAAAVTLAFRSSH